MKRIFISSIIGLIFSFLFINFHNVFAQTSIKTIDKVMNKPLEVVSGKKILFDVTITSKTINETSVEFNGTVVRKRPGVSMLIFGANDNENISLDPAHRENDAGIIDNSFIFGNNVGIEQGEQADFSAPIIITGLQKGTTYYFQIKDDLEGVIYEKVKFTTSGTPPNNGQITPASTDDQKKAIHVTVLNPDITPISQDPDTKYKVTFKGLLTTDINIPVGLSVTFGETAGSQIDGGIAFPEKTIVSGTRNQIEYTLSNFDGGKTYTYQFIDTNTNRAFTTPFYSFETPGTPPNPNQPVVVQNQQTPTPYNPDADTGILIDNYQYPTNIGEPVGDIDSEVSDPGTLVPCGKNSDTGEDKYCGFNHLLILFGNIIDYLLILLVPLTALVAVYTGVQMIIHRKVPNDLVKYKENFIRIGIGVAIMLLAWTIIATILKTLVGPESSRFILLDIL